MTFRKSGGNHCQFNVLPVSAKAAAGARSTVEQLARDHGVPLQPLDGPSKVTPHTLDPTPLSNGRTIVCIQARRMIMCPSDLGFVSLCRLACRASCTCVQTQPEANSAL